MADAEHILLESDERGSDARDGAQSADLRYVVDLRFVDPVPRLERRVA